MKKTKFLSILALLLMAVTQGAWADTWNGSTKTTPTIWQMDGQTKWHIEINTAAQLAFVAENWDTDGYEIHGNSSIKYYECDISLNADLDMTAATWAPLGSDSYRGTFNGNGHTIRFKTDDSSISSNYQGLFNTIHSDGTVKNLHVDCYIKVGNATNVAGIAGENEGTIENCWVSGHIESDHYSAYDADLGGIAGLNDDDGTIKYCCVTADIKNTDGNYGVGGIVGSNEGTIQHVTFTGSVSVDHSQDNKYVGDQDETLENYYDSFQQSEYDAASGNDMYRRSIKYTSFNFLAISSSTDWDAFVDYVNHCCSFSGKSVRLDCDVSTSSMVGDTDMNIFQGNFDGNGHTINLSINNSGEHTALFPLIDGVTIKNLRLTGSLTGGKFSAALVGAVNGTGNSIENCVLSVSVYGDNNVGGMVGHARSSGLNINGCVFRGAMGMTNGSNNYASTYIFVGGAVNAQNISVSNCLFIPTGGSYRSTLIAKAWYKSNNYIANASWGIDDATKAVAALPVGLGALKANYSMVRAYEHGIWFDNQYYMDPNFALSGFGTSGDPVRIGSTADWDKVVNAVNEGYTFSDMFVKQTSDISVSNMMGTSDGNSFQGTYDGDGKKLTFNKGTAETPFDEDYCAPFRHVKNATIKNLRVGGTIYTSVQKAAGLVGESHGALTITNCRSSVAITGSKSGDGTYGGFVATLSGKNNAITFDGCVFDGSFATTAGTTNCGGFVGWGVYNKPTVKNSLMIPASVDAGMLIYTFARWYTGDEGAYEPTITGCYYVATDNLPANQGTATTPDTYDPLSIGNLVQDNGMVKAYEHALLFDGKYYFDPATTTGSGTADAPFTISTADQWEAFAASVNNGTYNYSGKFVRLTDDIDITTTVGLRGDKPFSGTFLGGGHTITANIVSTTSGTGSNEQGVAPFHYVKDATIRDLTVGGTIASASYHTAGLVGFADGTNLIENCAVTATINQNNDYAGGFIGHGQNSNTTLRGCVFAGAINGVNGDRKNIGALWGWSDSGAPTLVNCLEAGTYTGIASMHPMGLQSGRGTITGCYYVTPQMGEPRNACTVSGAKQAYAHDDAPANLGSAVENGNYGYVTAYQNGLLYDGKYYVVLAISLADNDDNTSTINTNDGLGADVTLQGRTLYRDGAWNTLCLPFSVTLAGSPLAGAVARPLESASISESTLNLTFGTAVTTLQAGTPYIIKWDKADDYDEASEETRDLKNPVFSGVVIDATDRSYDNHASGDDRVRFLGTYASRSFDAEDKSILFMGGGNTLYYPLSGATLGAQRAYFQIGDDGEPSAAARRITAFNISFGGEENTTGILEVNGVNEVIGVNDNSWYSLDGRRLSQQPSRAGVYIYKGKKTVIK